MRSSLGYGYRTKLARIRRNWPDQARDIGKALGLVTAVFCIASLLVYGLAWLLATPILGIRGIEIKGLNELTEKDIYLLTEVRLSQNVFSVNLDGLVRKIQTSPWVREVSVSRVLPDKLKIEIVERKSLALLKKDDSFFLVDELGLVFKELTGREHADLPVINGWSEYIQEASGLSLRKMIELVSLYHERTEPHILGNLAEVHLSDVVGVTLFTEGGISVCLGFDDYPVKLTRFKQVWQDLTEKGMGKGFLRIDLSDPDKASVEWREVRPPKLQVNSKRGLRI